MIKPPPIKRTQFRMHDGDWYWHASLFGIPLEEGGWVSHKWLTSRELQAAHDRAIERSNADNKDEYEMTHQCGGCRYYGAFNADWGICLNEKSPRDLTVMFEHGGCAVHSDFEKAKVR